MSALSTEIRRILALAWPVTLAQVALMSMSVVDTLFVGRLDATQMAAVAVGGTWFFAVVVFAFGVVHALDPLFSQAWGAQDRRAAGGGLKHGLALVALMSPLVMLGHWAAPTVLAALGQPPEVVPTASLYCRIAAFGVPGMLAFGVLRLFLQAQSVMRPAMVAVVLANVLNALLDWLFVFGKLGAPALGAAGAAVATATCQYFQVAVLAWLARDRLREAWAAWEAPVVWGRVTQLLRSGVPVGFQVATESWAFQVATFLAGRVSTEALAAHGVVLNMASLSFMLPLGVSAAAATRVGNLLGAGERWTTAARAALVVGVGVMACTASVFALLPEPLVRAYTSQPEVVALAVAILPIVACFQLFDGTQVVAFGVLRGAGDIRLGALANLAGYWAFGLPVGAWLAFGRGLGLWGLWVGLALGLASVATILLARLRWTARHGGFRVSLGGDPPT